MSTHTEITYTELQFGTKEKRIRINVRLQYTLVDITDIGRPQER